MLTTMAAIVEANVESYQSDFEHDKEMISERGEFIWVVRENGTHLYSMRPEDYPMPHEVVPFLFGRKKGRDIVRGYITCLEKCHQDARLWYHVKNGSLRQIDRNRALMLFRGFSHTFTDRRVKLELARDAMTA
jgi:hypothetical protein